MNSINDITIIEPPGFPPLIKQMPLRDRPKLLYMRGNLPQGDFTYLTIVGSRKYSKYGKEVTETFIKALRGLPVVIVSGLALGIDSIAHEAALENNLKTVAVPGSGLGDKTIYPAQHLGLAHRILESGGALLSPFPKDMKANNYTFPQRNLLMAGISSATLVIEAEKKSGTLITSGAALEYNRDVLTVPGSIFTSMSDGPHELIKKGARLISSGDDLIEALGFAPKQQKTLPLPNLSSDEQKILELLSKPLTRDALFEKVGLETSQINIAISILEIKGLIEEKLGELRRV